MSDFDEREKDRITEEAALHREHDPAFAHWAAGYNVIQHRDLTQVRVHWLAGDLVERGLAASRPDVYQLLAAADRIASAGMWLVVHLTYARSVFLDGRDLDAADFKQHPEGHTGGALNMVPAYTGYLAANALSGFTRGWLMGQGHTVAAIDSLNLLVGNLNPEHQQRYRCDDEGLTRFVRDFYSYAISADGHPASPLGSHVNPHTAGGLIEGGYLGFAELQYPHMPLPGERLVAFLSDGAFEEQRGSDWAPRWWRAEDTGLVAPIMIANGRRIDQRTTVAQEGGVDWLRRHLKLNQFDPIDVDGRDPAAFAWAIHEMELRLGASARAVQAGQASYPVPLPYTIAETEKGFGFPGAGTNAAHNLPLVDNPVSNEVARQKFNRGARDLWVPGDELSRAVSLIDNHQQSHRVRERDHALLRREVAAPEQPPLRYLEIGTNHPPMATIDHYFVELVERNPRLRPRVGNPDELRSNGMEETLDTLKHRVTAPEPGVPESLLGKVITALNEEAVVSAALANKAGLNLVVTYEAFAVKMLGAIRQELIFARHQKELGRPAQWIAVPLLLTSHTWENGKNEQSHQDPTMAEALLGEMNDVSRVIFPGDANSALAAISRAYSERGQIWTLVVPKRPLPVVFDGAGAEKLVSEGALRLRGSGGERILLSASGGYQLTEALRAHDRLREHGAASQVVYLLEPGRFRLPRDERETVAGAAQRDALFPPDATARVFLVHTRPEPFLGAIRPLDNGAGTRVLGYLNRGGTLDTPGMLFANRCTWAHAVAAVAALIERPLEAFLDEKERAALAGSGDSSCLR